MEMGVGGAKVPSACPPLDSCCNFRGAIWEITALGIPPALKVILSHQKMLWATKNRGDSWSCLQYWWPWYPHKIAEAPTPLDAYSLLLLLTAVALAAGAHPSWVDLLYPFICFSAALNNIFIAPIFEHLFHI